jgi:hypothetical protein
MNTNLRLFNQRGENSGIVVTQSIDTDTGNCIEVASPFAVDQITPFAGDRGNRQASVILKKKMFFSHRDSQPKRISQICKIVPNDRFDIFLI